MRANFQFRWSKHFRIVQCDGPWCGLTHGNISMGVVRPILNLMLFSVVVFGLAHAQTAPAPFRVVPLADLTSATTFYEHMIPPESDAEEQSPSRLFERTESLTQHPYIQRQVVGVPDGSWVVIRFDSYDLGDSELVISSTKDPTQTQVFTQKKLETWGGQSARFNGGEVRIDLFIRPGYEPVYTLSDLLVGTYIKDLEVEAETLTDHKGAVGTEQTDAIPEAICDVKDDRLPSFDDRIGRIMPAGCTAFAIDNGTFITAGHCAVDQLSIPYMMQVLEFRVPKSLSDGTPQSPPIQHQFRIDWDSVLFQDEGASKDWATFSVIPNDIGRTPDQIYGSFDFHRNNENVSIVAVRGYGTDSDPAGPIAPSFRNGDSQTQQEHFGDLVEYGSDEPLIRHRVDTEGGNSGSPIFFIDGSGKTIGIHTHGGCLSLPNSFNMGTSFRHPALWDAICRTARRVIYRKDATYQGKPVSGLQLIADEHNEITVDFEAEFCEVEEVRVDLLFSGDLWDKGETWYMPEFGGQINWRDGGGRSSASILNPYPSVTDEFMDGRFVARLRSENGDMYVTKMEFTIYGKTR